jgi:hypothetical protein
VLLSFLSDLESRAPVGAVSVGPGGEPVSDTYMFVHQALNGDGTITARVTSLSGAFISPSPWAKAGIILEPDTAQGTAYTAVMVTGDHGVRMQDDYIHDTPGLPGRVRPSSSRWLWLTRAGGIVAGYDSADGTHWTEIGGVRLAGLSHAVQIGLFVSSPEYFAAGSGVGTPSVATASFRQVSVHGNSARRSWNGQAIAGFYPVASASSWKQLSASAFTITGSGDIAPLVGGILSAQWAGASVVNGTIVALIIVIVLATSFVTSEYRRGLIRVTLIASPRRGQVLAAKAIVAGSLAFAAGATATALAEVITRHILAANGSYLFPQSGPDLARVIIGTGLLLGLAAILAVALGTILRRSAIAVAADMAVLVLPGILGSRSGNWLMRFTPTAAFAVQATLPRSHVVTSAYTPPNGYFPICPRAASPYSSPIPWGPWL